MECSKFDFAWRNQGSQNGDRGWYGTRKILVKVDGFRRIVINFNYYARRIFSYFTALV
jgi:hypothetical protein